MLFEIRYIWCWVLFINSLLLLSCVIFCKEVLLGSLILCNFLSVCVLWKWICFWFFMMIIFLFVKRLMLIGFFDLMCSFLVGLICWLVGRRWLFIGWLFWYVVLVCLCCSISSSMIFKLRIMIDWFNLCICEDFCGYWG